MKIYFAGSITGGRELADAYQRIVAHLKSYGNVLTEHIAAPDVYDTDTKNGAAFIFNRDVAWLKESDVVVAEVSVPSIGVGYELGTAESIGKKILCLYNTNAKRRMPNMVSGNKYMIVRSYGTMEEAFSHIDSFFREENIKLTRPDR